MTSRACVCVYVAFATSSKRRSVCVALVGVARRRDLHISSYLLTYRWGYPRSTRRNDRGNDAIGALLAAQGRTVGVLG